MAKYKHDFVEDYPGLIGFGMDRATDENTLICYLQMFSNDQLMKKMVQKMTDDEMEQIFNTITLLLKKYLTEPEYHRLFLMDETH